MKPNRLRRFQQRVQLANYRIKRSQKMKIGFIGVVSATLSQIPFHYVSKKKVSPLLSKVTVAGLFFFLLVLDAVRESFEDS